MKSLKLIAAMLGVFLLLTPDALAGRRGRFAGGCSGGGCSSGQCGTAEASSSCSGSSCSTGVVAQVGVVCTPSGCTAAAPVCNDPNGNCAAGVPAAPKPTTSAKPIAPATDPLAQVNARRAARGLRPYVQDPGLTQAATAAVQYRARLRIRGHVQGGMGDFQFLPAGATATAAGADWYGATAEFATCAMTDNYTFAGAASAVGPDGEWYHQLFVR